MSQKPTLVILAAGMASRYGSLKQIDAFGPSGETIIDYSIFDAIRAGFKKIVFVIREAFAEEFKEIFIPKLEGKVEYDFVFQDLQAFLGDHKLPVERTKPFGTGQAILCCKGKVNDPFAVINADDFYGKDAFEKGIKLLTEQVTPTHYNAIGYHLINTISENGYVSRGQITTDEKNNIVSIQERVKIYQTEKGIVYEEEGKQIPLADDTIVSMNFFCFHNNFIDLCEQEYQTFLDNNIDDIKSEFFMPKVADDFIKSGKGSINVVSTTSKWFGVTYKEDAPYVKSCIQKLVTDGIYPEKLF